MKSYGSFEILLLLLTLGGLSCSKDLGPAKIRVTAKDNYDTATFNFVYVEGIKQKLLGNGGEALKYFEQCIKINPESDASYYQMAQIVIGNDDITDGKNYALKAVRINDGNIWYLTMLAGLYYQEKNLDSSIFYYAKAVKYFPEKDNLKITLGNLYSENKKYEKAGEIFEKLEERYGTNESSTASLIRNLMNEGKYPEAMSKAQDLLKSYPDNVMYTGILADIYRGEGNNEKALEVYNHLLERNPDNSQVQLSLCDFLITEKKFDDLFSFINNVILNQNVERENKISLMARLIDDPDVASRYGEKLTIVLMILEANYKDDNIVPLLRPELLIKQNKLVEASDRLEDIIVSQPDNYYAWEKLLFVYLERKDYNKLAERGEECASKFNRSFTAKLLYANGALETGKYSVSLDELKKAEILAADNKDFIVQVLTMRADVYYRMKDYQNAFDTFRKALKEDGNDLTVLNNFAYYLAEQNTDLKEAEEMAKKVTEKEKGNTTFLDTYGWVLYKRGKLKEAARIMESAINSGQKPNAVWFEHYGYILKKEKKCGEAVKNWKTALRLDSTKKVLIKEIEDCEK